MVLEPLEQAVLWVSLVAGLFGALAFAWQVILQIRKGRKSRLDLFSNEVLYPWSQSNLSKEDSRTEPLKISTTVPKSVLPERVAAVVTYDSIDLEELPGLSRGKAFLRAKRPEVWSEWEQVEARLREYEETRSQRGVVISRLVDEGMPKAYPKFKAAPEGSLGLDLGTYRVENITGKAEKTAFHLETEGTRFHLHLYVSKTSDDGGVSHELRNDTGLLKASSEEEADMDGFRKLLMAWTEDPQVQAMTLAMVKFDKELEKALGRFRSSLQEVTHQIMYG